jgi:Phage Connector (GP10).
MYYNIPVQYKGVTNVQHNFNLYFDLLVNKVCNLFVWEGLPETVDERSLNLDLILKGRVCFTKFNDKLYALDGDVGGEPNVYYLPQEFIIGNPILGSKQVRIR